MENMRSILMNQNAIVVFFVIAVAADMVSGGNDLHLLSLFLSQLYGYHSTGEAAANHNTIEHICPPSFIPYYSYFTKSS